MMNRSRMLIFFTLVFLIMFFTTLSAIPSIALEWNDIKSWVALILGIIGGSITTYYFNDKMHKDDIKPKTPDNNIKTVEDDIIEDINKTEEK